MGGHIKMIFLRMINHNLKVLVRTIYAKLSINAPVSPVLAIVMETSAKTHGLADS